MQACQFEWLKDPRTFAPIPAGERTPTPSWKPKVYSRRRLAVEEPTLPVRMAQSSADFFPRPKSFEISPPTPPPPRASTSTCSVLASSATVSAGALPATESARTSSLGTSPQQSIPPPSAGSRTAQVWRAPAATTAYLRDAWVSGSRGGSHAPDLHAPQQKTERSSLRIAHEWSSPDET
eukprot:CAMPEP_0180131112 /NCGR_PEP_ID=MMETSP0986-20121125/8237_1 /TAXON_ID=697907 /ORGANISM="non described non described, Strain CCMP2293" /LENGTH=178 /DNA_ID=CAMNT_0022070949 /DNA_START=264 /DNA_END=800 /DNA_ORIENTATION=+